MERNVMIKIQTIKNYIRFLIEDNIITSPSIFYKNKYSYDDAWLKIRLAELRTHGYTSIDGLLSEEVLRAISIKINEGVSGCASNIDISWNDQSKYWVINNPLMLDPNLVRIALDLRCLAIAERYFGRMPYLADVDMRRIPPVDMKVVQESGYSSSNWHRDTRGRQLKMMIYLTDVGANDSNFSFIPGSHTSAYRRKLGFMESRLTDEEVARMNKKTIEWYAKAGSVMIFDTNLIHRLRRKVGGNVRDSITFYYTPGQNTRQLKLNRDWHKGLSYEVEALYNPQWPLSGRI